MFRSMRVVINRNILKTFKRRSVYRNFTIQKSSPSLCSTLLLNNNTQHCSSRLKKKQARDQQKSETESEDTKEDDFDELVQDKHTKVLKIGVTSLRVDAILKSSLGIARNKIETLFYESKIRVNREKIQKKSSAVSVGDEIDIIKGPDIHNPNFTIVARVEILSIMPREENINVKIRRSKSLAVEDYK